MTTPPSPPSGWPPAYPPPQGNPAPQAPPSAQGVPAYPPPQGNPAPQAPPTAYPPPQGDPAYALVTGPLYPPPQGDSAYPSQGWLPAPLGGNPATWAPPGWPPPTALPPTASPLPAPGQVGFPPPGYPPAYPPAPAPHRSVWLTVAIVILVLAVVGVVGVLIAQRWNPAPPAVDQDTVEVTGGDIGTPVELTGPDGSGRVTVTGARWTSEGEVAPVPGTSYLIVDVQLEGVTGEITTGAVFTAVVAADGQRHGISYGPVLDPLLTSGTLRAGETNIGHLGYQLAPSPVQLEFQTPDGVLLGSVQIPGP